MTDYQQQALLGLLQESNHALPLPDLACLDEVALWPGYARENSSARFLH